MVLAYLVHGPTRVVLDGLRVYCTILGLVFITLLAVYVKRLLSYTRPVEWRGSVRRYFRAWRDHNKRLIGRIFLTASLFLAAISAIGTETVARWNHDMGYWRLPVNVAFVTIGCSALIYMLLWNSLSQEESPEVGIVDIGMTSHQPQVQKQNPPWVLGTIVIIVWLVFLGWLAVHL